MRGMEVKFFREESGELKLFKHLAGLYSEKRAGKKDEIVVLKARVSRSIVAVPVTRDFLGEIEADASLLDRITEEMRYSAKQREAS
jgi:hypothetical protein